MPSDERKVVRKLDFYYVLPFVFFSSFLQFVDKSTLGFSAVLGIREDTHISNDQFGFVGSIFFLGFLLAQLFCILFIQKFSVKRYLSFIITIWGIVLTSTAFAENFAQLCALRFILGLFEGGVYPCCIMIISRMYRRREQPRRVNFLLLGNSTASVFGGIIGYGIGQMVDERGLHPWQWLMIILGSVTSAFGICCFVFLIDDPKAKVLHLKPEQNRIVDLRILDNGVYASKTIKYPHIKESFKEPRYYCYIIAGVLTSLQNGGIFTFSSILISSFGFSNLETILISSPTGLVVIFITIFCNWFVSRYGNLHYVMCVVFSLSSIGVILIITIPVDRAKLLGVYLSPVSALGFALIFSSIANNVAGYTKKLFYISTVNAAFNLGNYIGPLLMVDSSKPLYIGAMLTFIAGNIIGVALLLTARHIMSKSNREQFGNSEAIIPEEEDMTDKENPSFIFRL